MGGAGAEAATWRRDAPRCAEVCRGAPRCAEVRRGAPECAAVLVGGAPVRRAFCVDEQVAHVRVGVEEAVLQHLAQRALHERVDDVRGLIDVARLRRCKGCVREV